MTFRPQLGPAASAKQVQLLRSLLEDAGYDGFRSARGPFGLTQRQGLGKFTASEAEALITQLELDLEEGDKAATPVAKSDLGDEASPRPCLHTPTDVLVAELRLRGWKASDF
jgi:hypothetical protein